MDQSGIREILKALKLHSNHMDEKLNEMKVQFDERFDLIDEKFNRMDERFDRIESKLNGFRVELTETQETVDFLSIKSAQHEKKLRNHVGQ